MNCINFDRSSCLFYCKALKNKDSYARYTVADILIKGNKEFFRQLLWHTYFICYRNLVYE